MRAYYFGCWNEVGHGMHVPGGHRAPRELGWPPHPGLPWDKIDAALAPRERDSKRAPELPQGVAALHHKDGWTALSFWDRTVDSRGNSNSNFFFGDELDFDQAVAAAREHFPQIIARLERAGIGITEAA